MDINSRLPDVGTTIFTVMSRLASEHNAINLSQGFPDFDIDPELISAVEDAMRRGHNQYAPMAGLPVLRQAIATSLERTYDVHLDPETEITVTAGATQAIFSAVAAFVGPGDEVIIFDPSYDSYSPSIRMVGGVPVHINLQYPHFKPDWDAVRTHINPRTRMIIVNTPHNPLGTVLEEDDMRELQDLAIRHGLIVLSDEVYDRLVYDGRKHQSVLKFPGLASRSLACFSFGKTFHATGWKVGYIAGPSALMTEVRKTHQFIVFSVNTAVQHGLATYLEDPHHDENIGDFYQRKRDFFLGQLAGSPFEPFQTSGSYFQLVSYRKFSSLSDMELARVITVRHKVATIPVSVFYRDKTDNKLLRLCFAKREETLARAGEILRALTPESLQ